MIMKIRFEARLQIGKKKNNEDLSSEFLIHLGTLKKWSAVCTKGSVMPQKPFVNFTTSSERPFHNRSFKILLKTFSITFCYSVVRDHWTGSEVPTLTFRDKSCFDQTSEKKNLTGPLKNIRFGFPVSLSFERSDNKFLRKSNWQYSLKEKHT